MANRIIRMNAETREEFILGLVEIGWGIIFLLPGNLLSGIERYIDLTFGLSDEVWGVVFLLGGLIVLPRSPLKWRKEAHASMSISWILFIIVIFLDGFSVAGFLIGMLCFIPAYLHFFRYLHLSQLIRI